MILYPTITDTSTCEPLGLHTCALPLLFDQSTDADGRGLKTNTVCMTAEAIQCHQHLAMLSPTVLSSSLEKIWNETELHRNSMIPQ